TWHRGTARSGCGEKRDGDIRHTRCSYASEEEGTPFMSDATATALHSNGTGVRISGLGAEIPPDVVTSAEVEERAGLKRFGFEPGWLARVTGVRASWSINWQPQSKEETLRSVAGLVVGDGGGALVVEACEDAQRGLRARDFRSDATQWRHATGGRFRPEVLCASCGSRLDAPFLCEGRDLTMAAAAIMIPAMYAVMERTGWTYRDLDVVFCHQPSRRFVDKMIGYLGVAAKGLPKLWVNVDRLGNVSTCSL